MRGSYESIHKTLSLYIGAERCGKSYLSKKVAKLFLNQGKRVVVYNQGRRTDYEGAERVKVMGYRETAKYIYQNEGKEAWQEYKRFPELLFAKMRGKIYELKGMYYWLPKYASFDRVFKRAEDDFFLCVYNYLADCLFIMDDAQAITRKGPGQYLTTLLGRKNHTGEEIPGYKGEPGMDIIMHYHLVDQTNPDIWGWATNCILYPTVSRPRFPKLDNPQIEAAVMEAWAKLDKEKQRKSYFFDAYDIKFRGQDAYKSFPIKGKKIEKI